VKRILIVETADKARCAADKGIILKTDRDDEIVF